MIVAGIDEAGYGPTLGPLVVSSAVFRVPAELCRPGDAAADAVEPDLWSLLGDSVSRKRTRASIPVNDSKKLHRPGKTLGPLEEGVLPFLRLCQGEIPGDLRHLVCVLIGDRQADVYLESYPWYRDRNVQVPTDSYARYLSMLAERLEGALRRREIEFLGLAALPIEVIQFNRALARSDNKAMVPFEAIVRLLRGLWDRFPDEAIEVIVDRQGGRIHYSQLLFERLRPRGIRIECQTAERSSYVLLRRDSGSMRVTFTRQGDAKSFAVALASMTSKYLRELHMTAFNRFWSEKMSDLRPTAGYPTDARRFLKQIAGLRGSLGIDDSVLIRRR